PVGEAFVLGHAAASVLARAIARGVYEARAEPGDVQPVWRSLA
ncbi:MAG: peptidase T4, partial [Paracoccus sp. (in: a-proteobacteria)]|nr:peptidase T4 [Paracoccus sp. (in: a-proteobacteria)]